MQGRGQDITFGRLEPRSWRARERDRAYMGVWVEPPVGVQGRAPSGEPGMQRAKPPEAESCVAFEAPAEEPNLTLVTVFMEIWRG